MLICKCFFLSNGRVCKGFLVLLCFDPVLWRVVSCVVVVGAIKSNSYLASLTMVSGSDTGIAVYKLFIGFRYSLKCFKSHEMKWWDLGGSEPERSPRSWSFFPLSTFPLVCLVGHNTDRELCSTGC